MNSLVLITNSDNQSFGTGFVVRKERNYAYIVTCSHVVEEAPKSLLVDKVDSKIIYQGSSDGIDLAVLKAPINKDLLSMMEAECTEFEIQGFRAFSNSNHVLEPISCKLDTAIEFRPQSGEIVKGWKVNIDVSDSVERGYSGSPLICKDTGKVVAVISNKKGNRESFAISIENLKRIWEDIPRNLITKKDHVPKIFISSAHRSPDIDIAMDFAKELNSLGHKTFLAKTDIKMGEDWLEKIQDELKECEYFLLILSEESLKSEMVLEELKTIKRIQNGSEFPLILPIRVKLPFDKNINYDLLRQINNIQQLVWENDDDTKKIVNEISDIIKNDKSLECSTEPILLKDTDVPVPNAPLILEQPTGTVPLDSRNYIERKDDQRCYANLIDRYSLIRIKAPRQYGKTSLLARLILKAKEEKFHVISFNFQELDKSLLIDLDELLEHICEMIIFEFDIEVTINKKILKKLPPKTKATKYMQKILAKLDKPLVIAIDEADRLFEYDEISDEFFGLIRAWHEKSKQDSDWENLKILLSHSTEPLLGISSLNQSPFHNVGLGIELKPFTKEEIEDLAERHSISLTVGELEKFMTFVGGHPFLSRKVLFTMIDEKKKFEKIIEDAHNIDSIFSDHMRRYLWILKDNKKLIHVLKVILDGGTCDEDSCCYILEATGLIRNTLNKPEFSCELYEEFFSKNL